MAGWWLQARHGTVRRHTIWQELVAATVTKNFSIGFASQAKGGSVFQPVAEKRNKLKSVGSFETSLGAHGPLIDGPDYTFLDGRPTPLRKGQIRRAKEQREAAARVLQLMKETQFAIRREQKLQQEQEEARQQGLQAKLKAKGQKMLQDQEK